MVLPVVYGPKLRLRCRAYVERKVFLNVVLGVLGTQDREVGWKEDEGNYLNDREYVWLYYSGAMKTVTIIFVLIYYILYYVCAFYFYFFSALTTHTHTHTHTQYWTIKLSSQLRTNVTFYCVYVIIFQYFTFHDDGCLKTPKHVVMKYRVN